ncbi:MAG TPA: MFS transporter [Devosiaceae bacterium]|nr:MFS transporter [Devosiaceae bacterium]
MDFRLFWLALGAFAIGAEGFVVSSLLPGISVDTGVTIAQGGHLVLAFALAYALGGPVLASFSGHRDRRGVLSASMLVFTIGNVIAGLAHSYEQLLIARVVMALAAGLYVATAQATAVAISEPHHRARAISVIVGGTTVAVAFGAPLGALIAGYTGWRGAFWSVAVIGFASTVAIWTMLPAGLKGPKLALSDRLAVIGQPGMVPALLGTFLPLVGGFTVFTYIAPLATETFGLSAALLPLILLAFGVGAAIGNFFGGQLADRIGATRTVMGSTVLTAAALATISFLPHLPVTVAQTGFLVLVVLWGIVAWSLPPAQASRVIKLAPEASALALSLNASALYLGVALGSVVGGEVLTYAAPIDLGWIAGLFPAAAFALLVLVRREPSLTEAKLG